MNRNKHTMRTITFTTKLVVIKLSSQYKPISKQQYWIPNQVGNDIIEPEITLREY